VVRNAILEEGASLHDALLEDSLIGENVRIQGRFSSLNVGDSSAITL
jgi:hypothetical protein